KFGIMVLLGLMLGLSAIVLADTGVEVLVQKGTQVAEVDLATAPVVSGTVAYQGPVFNADNENWKEVHSYSGVLIRDFLSAIGGMSAGDRLAVVATDGYYKEIPYEILYGTTLAGNAILALTKDGESAGEDAPILVFLPEDERLSNDDMLIAFGEELSHYYSGRPSTTGLMVKDVAYLIVNYDGGALPERTPVGESTVLTPGGNLTVIAGEISTSYTIADLEALDVVTAQGTFTNTIGVDYTATYTGVPIATLIGNVTADTTILVTAVDGYSMNYEAGMLLDRSEGTWMLAYKENGSYMPYDPGPLRVVLVGEDNPRFEGAISAKMVTRIDILGTYEDYSLLIHGAITRAFSRAELESGVGCPCHTSTVTVTSKGETHTYTGLPLWRLVAYVDDDRAPGPEQGIHYDEEDFNADLASAGYTIALVAEDGYTQSVTSQLMAHDDRFIVAFKRDGLFLDPAKSGYMRFVYDDSVLFPEGTSVKSVKFLSSIEVKLP
ncbi:MAG: molybdopterin-dependent oxidoreductase, partial [Candidatus Bipolaricaulota bacterium]|nr:molybdopterin-dependent oxidoreductase [Candidatus Bipolaricaulota bacterium]